MKKYDFQSIKDRMIENLRKTASWAEILPTSTNARIVDVTADALAETARETEYLTRESKHTLAQNRSSIVAQTPPLGYFPHRKNGSSGRVKVGISEDIFNGIWEDDPKSYDTDEIIFHLNVMYISLVDDNIGNIPVSSPLKWSAINRYPSVAIPFPKYSVFSNEDGTQYASIDENPTLNVDEDYIFINVIQGVPKSSSFVAVGINFEQFTIENDSIEENQYELSVNSTKWLRVDNIKEYGPNDEVYEITNNIQFTKITLKFGNGITGKKLSNGDNIIFKYLETVGIEGDILSQHIVINVDSTIKNTNGNIVDIFVSNMEEINDTITPHETIDTGKIVGGSDIEGKESIRVNSSRTYASSDTATGGESYLSKVNKIPFIFKATVWGEYEIYLDEIAQDPNYQHYIAPEENVVHISAYTSAGDPITVSQQREVRGILNEDKSPTDIPSFDDPEFIYLRFFTDGYTSDRSVTLSALKAKIIERLEKKYGLEEAEFFVRLNQSDYQRYIDETPDLSYHDTIIVLYNEYEFDGSTVSMSLSLFPISSETVEVFIKHKNDSDFSLIAVSNVSGDFVAESGYTATGTINYNTGIGNITVTGLPNPTSEYEIKVEYEIIDKNIIPNARNQVLVLKEDDSVVTANYYTEG